jgi:hypothetical protein
MPNRLVTSCRDCKWSTWENNKQSGCSFDLIENYESAGVNVIEAEDGNKEFNVIDRICLYSRVHGSSATANEVLESVKVNYQIIHFISDETQHMFSSFLDSLKDQEILPKHITVIRPHTVDVQPFKFTKYLSRLGIQWRYQDTTNKELSLGDMVDIAIDAVAYPYYVIADNPLPKTFSTEFNHLVNQKFTLFSYIQSFGLDIVATIHHKQLGGNSFNKLLLYKLKEDEQLRDYVYYGKDILECLK